MSLYIRVQNNFWNHRKTVRLKTKIGDDALWIMPRLWSYASENQPDGNFSDYTSEEIAEFVGCTKYATSIKQALIDVGFMEKNGCLHDWQEHNGFHFNFAERAKKAAIARWRRKGQDKKRNEMKRNETSIAPSMLEASPTPEDWSLDDCIKAAEPIAMKREDVQAFFNNYAGVGWIDAAGRKITNLAASLAKWKSNQPSHGKKYNSTGITNPERLEFEADKRERLKKEAEALK